MTVHTGVGKESSTTSNISFVISGELSDSGVRKLTDGKIQVSLIRICFKCLNSRFCLSSQSNTITFLI